MESQTKETRRHDHADRQRRAEGEGHPGAGEGEPSAGRPPHLRAGGRLLRLPVRHGPRRGRRGRRGHRARGSEGHRGPDEPAPPRGRRGGLQGRPHGRRVRDQEPERQVHLRLRPLVPGGRGRGRPASTERPRLPLPAAERRPLPGGAAAAARLRAALPEDGGGRAGVAPHDRHRPPQARVRAGLPRAASDLPARLLRGDRRGRAARRRAIQHPAPRAVPLPGARGAGRRALPPGRRRGALRPRGRRDVASTRCAIGSSPPWAA